MAGPFKMKGSPMQRNYGIGKPSPLERTNKNETVVTPEKSTNSYSEAYKNADKKEYKTEADFTKAAKAYNTKKYGTTEPTKESNKLVGQHKGNMLNDDRVTKKTSKKELENRNTTKKTNANSLAASKKANADGVESGKLVKKGDGVKVVNESNVSSKRKVSVKEARGRGRDSVKANRKAFGRGSAEVKAAKKARRESVRTAKASRREAKNK